MKPLFISPGPTFQYSNIPIERSEKIRKKGALPVKACPRENGDWDDIPQPSFPRTRESRIDNLVLDLIGDRNDDGKTAQKMEKSMESRTGRREKFRMAGLVCRYMSIDWIPAFAGMTLWGRGDDSGGFRL